MTAAGSSPAAPRNTLMLTPAISRLVAAPKSNRVELFVMIASIHRRCARRGPGSVKVVTHHQIYLLNIMGIYSMRAPIPSIAKIGIYPS